LKYFGYFDSSIRYSSNSIIVYVHQPYYCIPKIWWEEKEKEFIADPGEKEDGNIQRPKEDDHLKSGFGSSQGTT